MKFSNEKILNDAPRLTAISNKQLPVKISYAIAKNIKKIEAELNVYNSEREKLIEKYSVKDEDGKTMTDKNNQIKIQPEHIEDWNKDIKDLMAIENDVEIYNYKFKIDELNGYSISPAELQAIEYMIEE